MDTSLKQRLMGALVLISLAVIFLPLVFDGQQERIKTEQYEFPEQPVVTLHSTDFKPIKEQGRDVLDAVEAIHRQKQEQADLSQDSPVSDTPSNTTTPVSAVEAESTSAPSVPAEESMQDVATKAPILVEADTMGTPQQQAQEHIEAERRVDERIQKNPDEDLKLADVWMLQVGAFSSQENALALRDKLIAAGHKAYAKPVQGLVKVFVGPEIRRPAAEQLKSNLKSEMGINALILKYIP